MNRASHLGSLKLLGGGRPSPSLPGCLPLLGALYSLPRFARIHWRIVRGQMVPIAFQFHRIGKFSAKVADRRLNARLNTFCLNSLVDFLLIKTHANLFDNEQLLHIVGLKHLLKKGILV